MNVTGRTVFIGSVWAVGMRWGVKLLGLLGVLVLARVLDPQDFGIMAMAAILAGLLSSFLEMGVAQVIIRESNVTSDDLNTAWTLKIIQAAVVAIALIASAPLAASFFREPRIIEVVYVIAFAMVLGSFENIGMTLVRKELQFSRDFWYQILEKTGLVVITVALAFALRSFWALAFAQVAGQFLKLVLSFIMHPYRPRFSLKRVQKFLGFSVHITLVYIARFLGNKLDTFVVGRISDSTQMGIYNVASDLSSLPARELTVATGRAMFPALAVAKSDMNMVRQIFIKVTEAVAILCIPMAAGVWILSEELVMVLLGNKWTGAIELLGWLAVYGTLGSLFNLMIGHVLIVTGHERHQNFLMWARLFTLATFSISGASWGVIGIAIGATLASAVMLVVASLALRISIELSFRDLIRVVWRPTTAALLMAVLVQPAIEAITIVPARLVAGLTAGIVSYLGILYVLWYVSGRPDGLVATAVAYLKNRIPRSVPS